MWGTQERKIDARKQKKSGKQLLTVNSVNPSCSSALDYSKILSIIYLNLIYYLQ